MSRQVDANDVMTQGECFEAPFCVGSGHAMRSDFTAEMLRGPAKQLSVLVITVGTFGGELVDAFVNVFPVGIGQLRKVEVR